VVISVKGISGYAVSEEGALPGVWEAAHSAAGVAEEMDAKATDALTSAEALASEALASEALASV
jgi:hypothetical protein